MPSHDVVGMNCNMGTTTEIKAQVPSLWAKGRMLMIVCELSDLT